MQYVGKLIHYARNFIRRPLDKGKEKEHSKNIPHLNGRKTMMTKWELRALIGMVVLSGSLSVAVTLVSILHW